jgi:hypothetical protein
MSAPFLFEGYKVDEDWDAPRRSLLMKITRRKDGRVYREIVNIFACPRDAQLWVWNKPWAGALEEPIEYVCVPCDKDITPDPIPELMPPSPSPAPAPSPLPTSPGPLPYPTPVPFVPVPYYPFPIWWGTYRYPWEPIIICSQGDTTTPRSTP